MPLWDKTGQCYSHLVYLVFLGELPVSLGALYKRGITSLVLSQKNGSYCTQGKLDYNLHDVVTLGEFSRYFMN